jgi:hypothetical protein
VIDFTCNPLKCTTIFQRIQEWSFAGFKPDVLAERMGYDQYIRKQDRSIEAKPAQRLQGDLGRQRRIEDQVEKAARLFTHGPIFRQVAAGLAHQPDGRVISRLPQAGAQEGVVLEGGPHRANYPRPWPCAGFRGAGATVDLNRCGGAQPCLHA